MMPLNNEAMKVKDNPMLAQYIALGMTLVPLRPISKIPELSAWNDPAKLIDSVEKLATLKPNNNIGVVHELSRTITLDIDHVDYCKTLFTEFGIDYEQLLSSFPRIKSREGRDKIIMRLPQDFDATTFSRHALNWVNHNGECDANGNLIKVTVFEIRGGKNQDMMPPSIHPETLQPIEWVNGTPTEIPTAPTMIMTMIKDWESLKIQLQNSCPWHKEKKSTPQLINRLIEHPKTGGIIDQFNLSFSTHQLLTQYGYKQVSKNRFIAPSSRSGLAGVMVFDDGRVYSHHASDILNNGYAHDAFSLFTTLECGGSMPLALETARKMFGYPAKEKEVDISGLMSKIAKPAQIKAPALNTYTFPKHLLNVGGVLGDMMAYVNGSALYPQPVLELAACLTFFGALIGRKFEGETGIRSNLYTISVTFSGSGKEHARKAIKNLATRANCLDFIGGDKLASEAGLFNLLHHSPSNVVMVDEFGRKLRSASSKNASTHQQDLNTFIMELFGSADSVVFEKIRADFGSVDRDGNKTDKRSIINPNLCLYATTVPGRLFDSITPEEITDGFLPRFLVFESDTPDVDMNETPSKVIPQSLIDAMTFLKDAPINCNPQGDLDFLSVNPKVVPHSKEAKAIFKEAIEKFKKLKIASRGAGLDAIYARSFEHIVKLAMIKAVSDNIHDPIVTADCAQWAVELVEVLTKRVVEQASQNVSGSQYESNVMKFVSLLRLNGGQMEMTDIARKARWLKKTEREEIIAQLLEDETVIVEFVQSERDDSETSGGRAKRIITLLGEKE